MEIPKETELMELAAPRTSYLDMLDGQRDLFQNQIEKLQQIVATQCKLTGVNPLSQEMAAGALSIKIGKRPRDLLNPKAVKYMQLVFSVKDAISKRETREISAQFGVTATQVRDFFTGRRTRVRKSVRLSKEKASRSSAHDALHDETTSTSDPIMLSEPVPIDTIAPVNIDEGPSCSKRHESFTGMDESDLHFVENIFSLMRKEDSFSGQVKLLRWILRIENPSVLNWFLTEGGLMILATWLSEAAKEEQTSFLRVILKLLDNLPLRKALPVHMSAILQSVNRLRFYRTSGVFFYFINEVMGNESWDSKVDNSEEPLRFLCDSADNHRKLDAAQPLKMLTASGDDSNKRRGVLSSHTRERRKVQMVEYPSQRLAVRSPQVAKSTPATQSRPLSADDIQKAKMRAQFMQNKHGKTSTYPDEKLKPESQNRCTSTHASSPPSVSKSNVQSEPEDQRKLDNAVSKSNVQSEPEEQRKLDNAFSKAANQQEISPLDLEEPPCKKYKRVQIPWRTPPEIRIRETWHVGDGANSKEVEVQKNRIRREREIVYRETQEIPSDPREPWDREMDYDDTLTPEIPIEQLPDVEPLDAPVCSNDTKEIVASVASTSSESMPEPDLELLAELLKNPELVFALASGQVGDLSSDATVRLLDMIKAKGVSSMGNLSGNAAVEVSLPSPTPSSDPVPNGMKPDFSRNPFSRQHAFENGNAYQAPGAALPLQSHGMIPSSTLVQHQIPATTVLAPQPSATVQQLAYAVVQPVSSLPIQLPEQWQAPANPQIHHQNTRPITSNIQHLTTEMRLNANTVADANRASSIRAEPFGNVNPSPGSVLMSPSQSLAPSHPLNPQLSYIQEPLVSNSLSSRQGFDSNYHYQNNQTVNNYNAYAGGAGQAVLPPAGNWGGRNSLAERPEFESWSPDNSPSRRHEYLPGRYYHEPSINSRQGYRPERAMQQNPAQSSGYQDYNMSRAGNKRWQDHRRQ
ncbi:Homeobox protein LUMINIDEPENDENS [Sesamum alatum]|uniref:Homeobox protein LUMINIDEPENDENS n=1 Tax=Sesamum alatum TaxID=300844 RepID=A0AAE1XUH4_9LAMI|nr:Homeobox protein LUMINIDEPENDENS [Sesamum alatum]